LRFRRHTPGLVISHDVDLLAAVVKSLPSSMPTGRFSITTTSAEYLKAGRPTKRRRRERANADKTASALTAQADKMRAKATKARAAQQMLKRADKLREGQPELRKTEKVARLRFPDPQPCGKVPMTADGLTKSYGSLEVFSGVDLAIDRGARVVIIGLNGAGKTTLLRILEGVEQSDRGKVNPVHGLRVG
jgi:ATP-binding cassette subfamily F protein 3